MYHHHEEFAPPEELRDSIKCFWYDRSDHGETESTFEVMPDGYAEIIFHFGDGCSIAHNDAWQSLPSPFIMGLLNKPALLSTTNTFEVIAIRCYPWTVFDLLGLPSGKGGVNIIEHPIAQLHPKLQNLISNKKIAEAIAEVKNYFLNAHSHLATDSMLFKAGVAMKKANGAIPVNQVAAAANATVRTLERKFKQSSGHSVKDVTSLMRFQEVRNKLWHTPDVNLAGLAQEMGYADQAHLSKEFKRYTGTTPASFARKAKKGQQILSADFVAFVQA